MMQRMPFLLFCFYFCCDTTLVDISWIDATERGQGLFYHSYENQEMFQQAKRSNGYRE